MSYTPPEIISPVVLAEGYVPPPLSVPLSCLCGGSDAPQDVLLEIALPADPLELSAQIGVATVVHGSLVVALPPDVLPLSASLAEQILTAHLDIQLPPDVLDLTPALTIKSIAGVQITALLPVEDAPLSVAVSGQYIHAPTLAIGLPPDDLPLLLSVATLEDLDLPSDTPNPYPASVRSRQQRPSASDGCRMRQTEANRAALRAGLHQTQAAPIASGLTAPQTEMQRLSHFARLLETDGIRITGRTDAQQTETIRQRRPIRLVETDTQQITASARTPHAERIYTRTRREIREQEAVQTADWLRVGQQEALTAQTRLHPPQTEAMWPLPGRWAPCYETPSILNFRLDCRNPIPPELPSIVELQRCCAPRVRLPWVPPPPPGGQTIIIPIRRVYRVQNAVTLVRVSDGHPIDAARLSLALDAGGWTWTWSATLPAPMLDLIRVNGDPEELLATVNGESIRLRIDQISRSRAFGSASLSVSGRGLAAVLAGPAAPTITRRNTESRTAQQLLIDALTDNGVPIGWDVDWRLEDWSVPAGAWSHTGAYIEAATRIAEAGGGYVQGHDTDQTLIIRPYYPSAPWTWGAIEPDIVMPEDVCRTEGIEWREASDYNAVWITGSVNGRRDRIRRAGSAGDRRAPTVVDALATDEIMTRQRGIRVLGDTGRQAWVTVSLPVIAETGLIRPGALIRYSEQGRTHLGLSRSLSVDYQFPALWQTIKLETHPS